MRRRLMLLGSFLLLAPFAAALPRADPVPGGVVPASEWRWAI